MIVLGVDPGWQKSAIVVFNGESVLAHDIMENQALLDKIQDAHHGTTKFGLNVLDVLVCEQISMGGMVAGVEIFETCYWTGRFIQAWSPFRSDRIKRTSVKKHICGQMRANDSNIRQALIDRFGPSIEQAIGKKAKPGPLFGIKSHEWAALAVAVTWYDEQGHVPEQVRPGVVPEF